MGRPSKYDPETMLSIIESMGYEGESITALAVALNISKDTLYRWVKEHAAFSDAVKAFRARSQLFWEDIGLRGATGQIKGFNATAFIFQMKNRFADDYADRHEFGDIGDQARATSIAWRVVDPEEQ